MKIGSKWLLVIISNLLFLGVVFAETITVKVNIDLNQFRFIDSGLLVGKKDRKNGGSWILNTICEWVLFTSNAKGISFESKPALEPDIRERLTAYLKGDQNRLTEFEKLLFFEGYYLVVPRNILPVSLGILVWDNAGLRIRSLTEAASSYKEAQTIAPDLLNKSVLVTSVSCELDESEFLKILFKGLQTLNGPVIGVLDKGVADLEGSAAGLSDPKIVNRVLKQLGTEALSNLGISVMNTQPVNSLEGLGSAN
jgi:hypothetical protein